MHIIVQNIVQYDGLERADVLIRKASLYRYSGYWPAYDANRHALCGRHEYALIYHNNSHTGGVDGEKIWPMGWGTCAD